LGRGGTSKADHTLPKMGQRGRASRKVQFNHTPPNIVHQNHASGRSPFAHSDTPTTFFNINKHARIDAAVARLRAIKAEPERSPQLKPPKQPKQPKQPKPQPFMPKWDLANASTFLKYAGIGGKPQSQVAQIATTKQAFSLGLASTSKEASPTASPPVIGTAQDSYMSQLANPKDSQSDFVLKTGSGGLSSSRWALEEIGSASPAPVRAASASKSNPTNPAVPTAQKDVYNAPVPSLPPSAPKIELGAHRPLPAQALAPPPPAASAPMTNACVSPPLPAPLAPTVIAFPMGKTIVDKQDGVRVKKNQDPRTKEGNVRLVKRSDDEYLTLELEVGGKLVINEPVYEDATWVTDGQSLIFQADPSADSTPLWKIIFTMPLWAQKFASHVSFNRRGRLSQSKQTTAAPRAPISEQPARSASAASSIYLTAPVQATEPLIDMSQQKQQDYQPAFDSSRARISSTSFQDMMILSGTEKLIDFSDDDDKMESKPAAAGLDIKSTVLWDLVQLIDDGFTDTIINSFQGSFLEQLFSKVVEENGPSSTSMTNSQILQSPEHLRVSLQLVGISMKASPTFSKMPEELRAAYIENSAPRVLAKALAQRDDRQVGSSVGEREDVQGTPETEQSHCSSHEEVQVHQQAPPQSTIPNAEEHATPQTISSTPRQARADTRIIYSTQDLLNLRKNAIPLSRERLSEEVKHLARPLPPGQPSSGKVVGTTRSGRPLVAGRDEIPKKIASSAKDWNTFASADMTTASQVSTDATASALDFGRPVPDTKAVSNEVSENGAPVSAEPISRAQAEDPALWGAILGSIKDEKPNHQVNDVSNPILPKNPQHLSRGIRHQPTNSECDRLAKNFQALRLEAAEIEKHSNALATEELHKTSQDAIPVLKGDLEIKTAILQPPVIAPLVSSSPVGDVSKAVADSISNTELKDTPALATSETTSKKDLKSIPVLAVLETASNKDLKGAPGLSSSRWANAGAAIPVFTPKPYKAVPLEQQQVPAYNNFQEPMQAPIYYPRPPPTPSPFAPSIDSIVSTPMLGGRVLGPVLQTVMTVDSSGQMVPVTGIPVRQENYYPPPPQMAPSSFPIRSDMYQRHFSNESSGSDQFFRPDAPAFKPSPRGRTDQKVVSPARPPLSPVRQNENIQAKLQSRLSSSLTSRSPNHN
jgi:hypothetical protein